jgi:hypothetical protein
MHLRVQDAGFKNGQNLAGQVAGLTAAGCGKVYRERSQTGPNWLRPG